jgi:hypothetical protein
VTRILLVGPYQDTRAYARRHKRPGREWLHIGSTTGLRGLDLQTIDTAVMVARPDWRAGHDIHDQIHWMTCRYEVACPLCGSQG